MLKNISNFFNKLDQSLIKRNSFLYKKSKQTVISTKGELNAVFGALDDAFAPEETPPAEAKGEVKGDQ
jgi:hypothetical protein